MGSAVPVPAGRRGTFEHMHGSTRTEPPLRPRQLGGAWGAAPGSTLPVMGIPTGDTLGQRWAQPAYSHPWVGWELLPVLACEVLAIGVCHRDFTPSALLKGKKKNLKKKNLHFDSDSSSPILESVGLLQPTQGSSEKQNNSE